MLVGTFHVGGGAREQITIDIANCSPDLGFRAQGFRVIGVDRSGEFVEQRNVSANMSRFSAGEVCGVLSLVFSLII